MATSPAMPAPLLPVMSVSVDDSPNSDGNDRPSIGSFAPTVAVFFFTAAASETARTNPWLIASTLTGPPPVKLPVAASDSLNRLPITACVSRVISWMAMEAPTPILPATATPPASVTMSISSEASTTVLACVVRKNWSSSSFSGSEPTVIVAPLSICA